jgi:hypothetical protein
MPRLYQQRLDLVKGQNEMSGAGPLIVGNLDKLVSTRVNDERQP